MFAAGAPRVLAQHLRQAGQLAGGHFGLQLLGKVDVKLMPGRVFDPSAAGVWVAVGERDVGLDVVDGRAVAQVRAQHVDDGAGVHELHAVEFHARQSDGIRAERAACGEHAHALGAAQPRWPHGRRPARGLRGGGGCSLAPARRSGRSRAGDVGGASARFAVLEAPEQPQVREAVDSGNGAVQRVFRFEHDAPLQMWGKEAVAGDAELLRQIGMYVSDRFHARYCIAARCPPAAPLAEGSAAFALESAVIYYYESIKCGVRRRARRRRLSWRIRSGCWRMRSRA